MHLQVEIYLLQNNMFFPAVSCGNIWISSCHLIRTAILIMQARRSNGRFIFAAGTPIHGKTVFILKRIRGLDPECMFVSPFPCWTMGSACLKTGLQVPWVLAPPDVSTVSCFVHITCISLHMFSDSSYNRHIYIYILFISLFTNQRVVLLTGSLQFKFTLIRLLLFLYCLVQIQVNLALRCKSGH